MAHDIISSLEIIEKLLFPETDFWLDNYLKTINEAILPNSCKSLCKIRFLFHKISSCKFGKYKGSLSEDFAKSFTVPPPLI